MREITKRQAQVIIFIENFIQKNDYAPTIREIADHFKISVMGARDHVIALEKKGCISYQAGKSRTISIKKKIVEGKNEIQ